MQIKLNKKADKQYDKLPKNIQKKVDKQFSYLLQDFRHSSLKAKLYRGTNNLWQARIDKSYRFYFYIVDPHYIVVALINHPK
jgi:mRNA-degrading endonuclease RelE of RelBE toxin-antitoxin system